MTEPTVICNNCGKALHHHRINCPLFPDKGPCRKWKRCVCLVHTCYMRPQNTKRALYLIDVPGALDTIVTAIRQAQGQEKRPGHRIRGTPWDRMGRSP